METHSQKDLNEHANAKVEVPTDSETHDKEPQEAEAEGEKDDPIAAAAGMPQGGLPNDGIMKSWQIQAVLMVVSPAEKSYPMDMAAKQGRWCCDSHQALELAISTWLTFPPEDRPP